jgi:hypothetical protein
MVRNAYGHEVPPEVGVTPNMQAALKGLSGSVRDVKYVANLTARAQLVSDITAAGGVISATNPLVVYRGDALAHAKLEVTENGTAWAAYYTASAATYTPTVTGFGSGFVATGRYTRIGPLCVGKALVDLSTNGATGEFSISLPFAIDTSDPMRPGVTPVGAAFGFTDQGVRWTGVVVPVGSQTVVVSRDGTTNANSRWGVGVPGSWTSTGFVGIEFSFEIAAGA